MKTRVLGSGFSRAAGIGLLFVWLFIAIESKAQSALAQKLEVIDSLVLTGERKLALKEHRSIDVKKLKAPEQKAKYYLQASSLEQLDYEHAAELAKEAVTIFDNTRFRKQNPDLYFKALVINGEANYHCKNYLVALNYFVEAKSLLKDGDCRNGVLFGKFANIYFGQKNYENAAKYYIKSYHTQLICDGTSDIKPSYFFRGMALNNAGFSYFKNGQLDSAAYYYNKFEEDINDQLQKKKITQGYANILRTILYDNKGGLALAHEDAGLAASYLEKAINMPVQGDDFLKVPPFLKLAKLYTQSGQIKDAEHALKSSMAIISRFKEQSQQYYPLWVKRKAELFKKTKQADSTLAYQEKYIVLHDSVDAAEQELYSIDVAKELEMIHQRFELNQLRQDDKVRRMYVAGLIEFVLFIAIIFVLVYLHLRKTRKLHQEAVQQNETIKTTIADLERANKNYIRIMRVMAHDLRNPLSGMTGIASALLYEEELDEESKKLLKLIETTGLHSIEMINELLKTGLGDEEAPVETQEVDLVALVYDSMELLQFKAKEKQQNIVFDNKTLDPIFAQVNYEKIWRVVNNLIVNAIKFSYANNDIHVGVTAYNASTVVYVKDKGMGVPEQDKDSIFDMFTNAKRTGTNGEQAFGLGLSISKKVMEKHQGKIWFENNIEGGSTFFLEFPK